MLSRRKYIIFIHKKFCKRINFFDFLSIYLKSSLTNHAIPHYGTIYGSLLLKKRIKLCRLYFLFDSIKINKNGIFFVICCNTIFNFFREYLNIDNEFFFILRFFLLFYSFLYKFIYCYSYIKKKIIFETLSII